MTPSTKLLIERIKELEDALRFYADKRLWEAPANPGIAEPIYSDRGEKARLALKND